VVAVLVRCLDLLALPIPLQLVVWVVEAMGVIHPQMVLLGQQTQVAEVVVVADMAIL
jgi:hypothetical protein